ncbi:MAG: class I SAM-dependent methyltransferase [Betaproteobacteria bacterium]
MTLSSASDTEAALRRPSHLEQLGRWLLDSGYRFVTVTPATHARVNARAGVVEARGIEDVFGWSRPFRRELLPANVLAWLDADGMIEERSGLCRTRVRYSTLGGDLFVHSAFPTTAADAVFFGPDTYRFASLISATLGSHSATSRRCVVDVGCGSGAGGIVAARAGGMPGRLILADINPTALRHARVNAALAGIGAEFVQCDLFSGIDAPIDLIVANPPYLVDPQARVYRDGGGARGSALSLRIVHEGLERLAPGGMLVLYTGSCIVRGEDLLHSSVVDATRDAGATLAYSEIDPDVFGEELALTGYDDVDRIAVIAAVITTRR